MSTGVDNFVDGVLKDRSPFLVPIAPERHVLYQAGNVWEWCEDIWHERAYDREPEQLDPGPRRAIPEPAPSAAVAGRAGLERSTFRSERSGAVIERVRVDRPYLTHEITTHVVAVVSYDDGPGIWVP